MNQKEWNTHWYGVGTDSDTGLTVFSEKRTGKEQSKFLEQEKCDCGHTWWMHDIETQVCDLFEKCGCLEVSGFDEFIFNLRNSKHE